MGSKPTRARCGSTSQQPNAERTQRGRTQMQLQQPAVAVRQKTTRRFNDREAVGGVCGQCREAIGPVIAAQRQWALEITRKRRGWHFDQPSSGSAVFGTHTCVRSPKTQTPRQRRARRHSLEKVLLSFFCLLSHTWEWAPAIAPPHTGILGETTKHKKG